MVEIALDVALVALQVGEGVVLAVRQGPVPVAHSVGLQVCLSHHVKAVLVAQVVEVVVVGIMACTYGIYVEFLHYADVLEHTLAGYHVTAVRVQFVAVHSLEQHRLPVYQDLGVHNLHLPESHLDGDDFSSVAYPEGVQVRILRIPFLDVPYVEGCLDRGPPVREGPGIDALPVSVKEFQDHRIVAAGGHLYAQGSVSVLRIQVGGHTDVIYPVAVAGKQVAVSGYSAKAEEVLVLQVGAVAPAENLQGYEILLARLYITADVKFRLHLAVLAVTHITAVHPNINVGRHGPQVQENVLAGPTHGKQKLFAVGSHVVIFLRHGRGICPEMVPPGISVVDV